MPSGEGAVATRTDLQDTGDGSRAGTVLSSLSVRIAIAFLVVVVAVVSFTTLAELDRSNRLFLTRILDGETHRADIASQGFRHEIADLRRGVAMLRESGAVRGLVGALSDPGTPPADVVTWREKVEVLLAGTLESHSYYRQVRLIGLADGGREIVRVDRIAHFNDTVVSEGQSAVRRTAPEDMQRKGSRGYFRETQRLAPGEVYLSDINLNREYGAVEEPHWATIRAGTLVYGPDGAAFGMVVINADADYALEHVRRNASPGTQVYLMNPDGDFLIHPDPSKEFGFDLGAPHRWQDYHPDFPLTTDEAAAVTANVEPIFHASDRSVFDGYHIAQARIRYDPDNPAHFATLVYMLESNALAHIWDPEFLAILAVTLGTAAVLSVAILFYLRHTLMPLNQLSAAARSIIRAEFDTPVPTSPYRELAPLVTAMRDMLRELRVRSAAPVMMHSVDRDGTLLCQRFLAEVSGLFPRRRDWPPDLGVPGGRHAGSGRDGIVSGIPQCRRDQECRDGDIEEGRRKTGYRPIRELSEKRIR